MESVGAAISASCPSAFGGTSGALFVKAVTALVAAHCGIVEDSSWPEDEASKILADVNPTYDFVIIGAGTAGSIVASRLSSDFPHKSVLLIEAGDDPGLDSEVPASLFLNQDTNIDWHYGTYPDDNSCLGLINNSCIWSKGRAMDGSSSINAMIYIRGHPNDYDQWSENVNSGWNYKDLGLYFDKIEKTLKLDKISYAENTWYDVIKGAWNELGFSYYNNYEARSGTKIAKLLTKDGKRLNTAKVYLSKKPNLCVMKNTVVQKIIIDSTIARSVEIRHTSGKVLNINIKKEVILSAGSVATPQILMLSGIGPKKHLETNKIRCLLNLNVGRNLQDHVLLPIFLKINQHTYLSPKQLYTFVIQYMMDRTGPFSNIGITDFMGFMDTKNNGYPNIQFHHTYFVQNDTFMLRPYLKGVGFNKEIIQLIEELNKENDLLGIYPTLLHPKSRGRILLADADPKTKPIIKANYFKDPEDLQLMIKGIEFIQKLSQTDSFRSLGMEVVKLNITMCSKLMMNYEDYWECYIRHMATTVYHPVGTAKKGLKVNDGVVNEDLIIHGMRNVRVVDASIMATITSGNTMAPTMAIAEKAADIIQKYYATKQEL